MKLIDDYVDKVICGDCLDMMRGLPDGSIDCVIADPPYGMGLAKWDIKIDIPAFTQEVNRLLKPTGFYAFFGQMPYVLEWLNESGDLLTYKEHITWVKRLTTPSTRLSLSHEELLIYSKGNSKFYQRRGKYEAVKTPGLMFDVISLQAINRYISELWYVVNTGEHRMKASGGSRPEFSRFALLVSQAVRDANFTNVWSFLPENNRTYGKAAKEKGHPTRKPILLTERLVEMLSDTDQLILDPFLGSGTTAVAAQSLGRHYIGIEKNPEYCRLAEKRIDEARAELESDLFAQVAD